MTYVSVASYICPYTPHGARAAIPRASQMHNMRVSRAQLTIPRSSCVSIYMYPIWWRGYAPNISHNVVSSFLMCFALIRKSIDFIICAVYCSLFDFSSFLTNFAAQLYRIPFFECISATAILYVRMQKRRSAQAISIKIQVYSVRKCITSAGCKCI